MYEGEGVARYVYELVGLKGALHAEYGPEDL
jgi:hypothetical protein